MKLFPYFDTIFEIGSFQLRWYPVLLTLGGLFVYYASNSSLKKQGYPEDIGDDLFIGCTIGAVIGARLWYCVFYDLEYYFSNPINIIKTWEGGLAIQGAILGGVVFIFFYSKKKHYDMLRVCDNIFPYILVGQAIGRWGNFFNQEAFGRVVEASFYENWPSFIADHMYINGAYQEPTFLYESILNFVGFLLINFIYKKYNKPKRGDLVYAYLMWYGVDRFIVESMRSDSLMIGNLKMAQVTCVFCAILGVFGTFGLFRKLQKKPVILFDFDQTLAQTQYIIWESFEMMFKKYLPDHPFGEEEKKYVIGPTLNQSFEHYNFPIDSEKAAEEYRVYNNQIQYKIKESPNATEVLGELKKQGYKIGIVTSKKRESINNGLKYLNFKDYIDVIVAVDDVSNHKPDPEGIYKATIALGGNIDNCIYVGDVCNDVETALNAHAYAIAYNIDPKNNEELASANPNNVINDLKDILKILQENDSWTNYMN